MPNDEDSNDHQRSVSSPEADRKQEVLREALALVAEEGIAGASLRKLARRLGLSQPSLYHYFSSKDDLIDQLAEMGARHMVDAMHLEALPRVPLERIPHVVKDDIFELWKGEEHVRYSKFLFVVAIESPRHRKVLRRVFEERLFAEPSKELRALVERDAELAERLVNGLILLARAIGLALIEERILFGLSEPRDETRKHAEFVAEVVVQVITKPRI
jgi:AcrR family transcriptional regulator